MPEMYEVLRVINSGDGSIYAGTIVDASEWRNKKALINAGRLRRLEEDEVVPASPKPKAAKPKASAKPKVEVTEEVIEEVTEDVN